MNPLISSGSEKIGSARCLIIPAGTRVGPPFSGPFLLTSVLKRKLVAALAARAACVVVAAITPTFAHQIGRRKRESRAKYWMRAFAGTSGKARIVLADALG